MTRHTAGYAAIAGTVLVWGSAYPVIYVAEKGISPVALAALRAAVGGAFLAAVFRRVKAGLREFIGGLINIAAMISLLNLSILMTPNPSTAAVLIYTQPLFTALMTAGLLRRRVGGLQYAGIGVGVIGIMITVVADMRPEYLLGIVIGLLGGFVWAAGTIYFEKYLAGVDVAGVTAFMSLSSAPIILAMWPLGMYMSLSPRFVALDLYIAVVVQGVGWLLWFYSVRDLGGVRAGALSMLAPVVAIGFTALILHEALSGPQAVGAALIVIGSVIVQAGGLKA